MFWLSFMVVNEPMVEYRVQVQRVQTTQTPQNARHPVREAAELSVELGDREDVRGAKERFEGRLQVPYAVEVLPVELKVGAHVENSVVKVEEVPVRPGLVERTFCGSERRTENEEQTIGQNEKNEI